MRYWTRAEIDAGAALPEDLEELVASVSDEVEDGGRQFPRLSRAGIRDEGDDHKEFLYELELELTPGLILPVYCGYLDPIEEDLIDDDIDFHVATVMEGLPICLAQRDRLADLVHDARMRSRRFVGAQNAAGFPTRLIDVTLAPYDAWRGEVEPALLVHLEDLGPELIPMPWEISIERTELLEQELAWWRDQFSSRSDARTELLALGASGRVSQLALNAITHHGDAVGSLRRFATESRFWLPDNTALLIHDGRVVAGNGNSSSMFQWNRNGFTVASRYIGPDLLGSAVGRPVTDLVEHPFLSPDMTVTSASNAFVDGVPILTVGLHMPYRLFCSTSGRVWDEAVEEAQEPEASGRVVAFRRREG